MPISARDRPQHLHNQDHAIVTWYLTMPPDVTVEELTKPETWAAVANKQLRPFHRVRVDAETGEWSRVFMVQTVGQNSATLALESEVTFGQSVEIDVDAAPKYRHEYKGPVHKHRVVRISDGAVVLKDIATKADCIRWINDRAKVEAA